MYFEPKVRSGCGSKMRYNLPEIKQRRGAAQHKNTIFRDQLSGVYFLLDGCLNQDYAALRFAAGKR
ncbi:MULTISPECIES: hypothetical protein [unclassified Brucella]|uniref:hypothetical protein n=1 Tax=unclassified Brucella TaxID=2632610 RepID=UPI002877AB8C|nr:MULTISPECIES: hypothetical protein [unclassified Brucella]